MKTNLSALIFLTLFSICISCKKDDDNDTVPATDKLELVYSDNTYQLTGVAKESSGGNLIVNYPRWSGPYKYGVVKVTGPTSAVAFPDDAINTWIAGLSGENKWVCVQSVYYDANDRLWILDPASPNM